VVVVIVLATLIVLMIGPLLMERLERRVPAPPRSRKRTP
jgi:hypothetical protein